MDYFFVGQKIISPSQSNKLAQFWGFFLGKEEGQTKSPFHQKLIDFAVCLPLLLTKIVDTFRQKGLKYGSIKWIFPEAKFKIAKIVILLLEFDNLKSITHKML